MGSTGWIDIFKKRSNIIYKTSAVESMSNDSETEDDWKNDQLLQGPQNMISVTHMTLIRHAYFSVYS